MKYTKPPSPPMKRRVYVLPAEMVDRIMAFGFDNGCASEVEAVRTLIQQALETRRAEDNGIPVIRVRDGE